MGSIDPVFAVAAAVTVGGGLLVVTVPVVGFVAVLLASRLVLVWMGQIEKM